MSLSSSNMLSNLTPLYLLKPQVYYPGQDQFGNTSIISFCIRIYKKPSIFTFQRIDNGEHAWCQHIVNIKLTIIPKNNLFNDQKWINRGLIFGGAYLIRSNQRLIADN